MSRRFSDEPVNLIHRIPSPEQMSAVRPSKRSFGQAVVETGAACIRGAAEVVAQGRRLGRIARMAVRGGAASSGTTLGQTTEQVGSRMRTLMSACSRSYDRLAEWIANLDVTVQPVRSVSLSQSDMPAVSPQGGSVLGPSIQHEELAELRAYILAQQEDISRLSAHLQELKSLVVSQQQVLVYLGKELESTQTQLPTMTGVASAPAKRNRVVREKAVAKDKPIPRKGSHKPSLNL
jgi:hypothetical protein